MWLAKRSLNRVKATQFLVHFDVRVSCDVGNKTIILSKGHAMLEIRAEMLSMYVALIEKRTIANGLYIVYLHEVLAIMFLVPEIVNIFSFYSYLYVLVFL